MLVRISSVSKITGSENFTDLKYKPCLETEHVCHPLNAKHESCVEEIYSMYIGSVQACSNELTAFYLKQNFRHFSFDKQPVEVTTVNNILPSTYKEGSLKRKIGHATVSELVVHLFYLTQLWKRG